MYFGNRRPRGFHYTYRFSDEQRDLIDNLRRGVPPDELARQSLASDDARPTDSRRRPFGSGMLLSGVIVVISMLLLLVFALLLVLWL